MTIVYILFKLSSLHGSITHYFHFFYGVLVPLILEYQKLIKIHKRITIIIEDDIGPMLRLLLELPIDIKLKCFIEDYDNLDVIVNYLAPMDVQPSACKRDDKMLLKGWAKKFEHCHYIKVNQFMSKSLQKSNINIEPFDIITIERVVNKSYKSLQNHNKKQTKTMLTEEVAKSNGSDRRSITNHDTMVQNIRECFDQSVLNVSTEFMPLIYQYALMSNCKVLIAQHGAVLSEIAFLKPGTIVIEIIDEDKINSGNNWFKVLADACQIEHHQYVVKDSHVTLDLPKFMEFIKSIIK
jgi:hypothetical protein